MHAVVRETRYAPDQPIVETKEFREFQQAHEDLEGYHGTVVVDVGAGRFITLTIWRTLEEMSAAKEAMGSVVGRTIEPLMSAPAKLLGTGPVAVDDLSPTQTAGASGVP